MWEGGKYSPFFSSVKDEGCGKGGNIPHFFHQRRMRDVERGKFSPFFHQGRMRDTGRGKYSSLLFIQGRMRNVGREKISKRRRSKVDKERREERVSVWAEWKRDTSNG